MSTSEAGAGTVETVANIGNPELWARFGLEGLVIFALFILILILIKEMRTSRTEFLSCLDRNTLIYDTRQKESNEVINGLSLVIERNTRK